MSPSQTLAQFAIEMTYQDVELLLHSIVHRHVSKYGGDYEELRAQANVWFLEAYQNYNPDKGRSFSSWVYFAVSHWLLEVSRTHAIKNSRLRQVDVNLDWIEQPARRFRLFEFLDSVGEDARTLAKLVLETPNDLRFCLHEFQGNTQRQCRKALREYLELLGWSQQRIEEAFTQLEMALV